MASDEELSQQFSEIVSLLKEAGIKEIRSLLDLRGGEYTLRKKPEPKKQPQEPASGTWQERTTRRLTPKKQRQKTMEVFLDEHIRDGIKALAVVNNMPAQDYAEHILTREVEQNEHLVQEGLRFLEQTHGNLTNARLKYLQEKVSEKDSHYSGFHR